MLNFVRSFIGRLFPLPGTPQGERFYWHTIAFFPVVLTLFVALSDAGWSAFWEVAFFGACATATVSLEICIACTREKVERLMELGELARSFTDSMKANPFFLYKKIEHSIDRTKRDISHFAKWTFVSFLAFTVLIVIESRRITTAHAKKSEQHNVVAANDFHISTKSDKQAIEKESASGKDRKNHLSYWGYLPYCWNKMTELSSYADAEFFRPVGLSFRSATIVFIAWGVTVGLAFRKLRKHSEDHDPIPYSPLKRFCQLHTLSNPALGYLRVFTKKGAFLGAIDLIQCEPVASRSNGCLIEIMEGQFISQPNKELFPDYSIRVAKLRFCNADSLYLSVKLNGEAGHQVVITDDRLTATDFQLEGPAFLNAQALTISFKASDNKQYWLKMPKLEEPSPTSASAESSASTHTSNSTTATNAFATDIHATIIITNNETEADTWMFFPDTVNKSAPSKKIN